jgi:acyl-CoA synthetase (AMP-forming)/AMP-acid ligase II
MRMHELLERNASRAPDKTFLFSELKSITNMEASRLVQAAAAGFRSLGVMRGDRVLIFAPNSIEYVIAMFVAFKLGAIAALIDVLDPEGFHRNVRRLSPKLVVSTSKHVDQLRKSARRVKFVSFDDGNTSAHSWQGLLGHRRSLSQQDFKEDAPCHLSFTSGTTYEPKPAVLSHEPTLRATRCIAERLGLNDEDTSLGITTLSSSHIFVYAILPQMHRQATTGIMESWDAARAWHTIQERKVRLVSGTAMRLSELADYAKEHAIERDSLRLVLSGGSAGIGRIRQKWQALGVQFVETYGMSELGGSVAFGYPWPFKSRPVKPFESIPTVGPPLPDKEVRIADEKGKEVPVGVPGEILVRGGFMWGYWRMPRETAKAARRGWLHTSDIGFTDEFDNIYWLARKTDIIQTEGGPVYPRVIEEVLFSHQSVRQACVIGLPKGKHHTPVAFVTLFSDKQVREEDLLAYFRTKLGEEFWPSKIMIQDTLPMTPTGKIDKRQLKRL